MNQLQINPDMGDILIVDDKPENIKFLANFLSSHGYSIRKSTNGVAALKATEIRVPDLILLDINMPIMGGYEVCKQLKADPKTLEIPVVFLSASNEVEDKRQAFQVGGIDYITKPFQLEEVLVRVQTHLKLKALQNQLTLKNQELEHIVQSLTRAQADLEATQSELLAWKSKHQ
jgi:adenylate cyclase